jgi:hypothetical protein
VFNVVFIKLDRPVMPQEDTSTQREDDSLVICDGTTAYLSAGVGPNFAPDLAQLFIGGGAESFAEMGVVSQQVECQRNVYQALELTLEERERLA